MRRLNIIAVGVFLLLLSLLFALSPQNTRIIQSKFLGFIAPFLKTGSSLQMKWVGLREGLKTLPQLEQENTQLRVELKELKATNQMLRDLAVENTKLRRALVYRDRSEFKLVPARIIARDTSTWWSTVKVDKGFDDGIKPDVPVLTEDGLVGKTTTVASNASTVLLISDENCKVASTVEGTREQGIVRGERTSTAASPDLLLNFLSKNADLKPGQKVYSSGVGGVYPSGVLIGVVKKFEVRPLDGVATVVPAVDLTTLEDVFIVTGKK
jgi:rod shape-determining protein MreC